MEQRRANLIGWVGAPFRMGDLMAGLGGERERDLLLSIYDGADGRPEQRCCIESRRRTRRPARTARCSAPLAGAGGRAHLDARHCARRRSSNAPESDEPRARSRWSAPPPARCSALLVWSLASGRRRAVAAGRRDDVQLSESEFRWKYALEGAGDGVWDWNRGSGEVLYSRRWKEMLGYSETNRRHAGGVGAPAASRRPAGRAGHARRAISAAPSRLTRLSTGCAARTAAGCWIRGRGMAVTRDALGLPLRTIGTHTDITRLKKDEAALRRPTRSWPPSSSASSVILENSHDAFIAVAPDGRVTDWSAKAETMLGWSAGEAVGQRPGRTDRAGPESARRPQAGFQRFVQSGRRHADARRASK